MEGIDMRHGSSLERCSQRRTAEIVAWLLRDGRRQPSHADLIHALGARLVAAGVPVWRIYVGLHQLHPAFLQTTDNAYVRGDITAVRVKVEGYVADVLIRR
jgi:multidrug resistance efflux pump